MGMRSTQRSESLHGVIEGLVSTKLSLTELFYVLDYIKEMQNIKQQRAVEKKPVKLHQSSSQEFQPLLIQ